MPKPLIMAVATTMIGLAATGVAQARGANLRSPWSRQQKQSLTSGYVRELSTWDMPGHGVVRLAL
jgi:hypothetical protein